MAVVDTLVTRYVMDAKDYDQGARSVTNSTAAMAAGLSDFNPIILAATAALAVLSGGAMAAGIAIQKGMNLEAQTQALSLYADGVNTTESMLKRLRDVAKLPGLGNIEAIQGAVRLMAGGMDFTLATRSMMAFGNALASAGGGKEELDGVMLALTQIASKGKVSAEEINQIAERVPQIRQGMIEAFGTADTEALQKMGISAEDFILGVVGALETLPKAKENFKNAIGNLGDFAESAFAMVGMGINGGLIGPLQEALRFGEYLISTGVFAKVGEALGKAISPAADGSANLLVTAMAYLVATLEEIPSIIEKVTKASMTAFSFLKGAFEGMVNIVAGMFNALGPLGFGIGDKLKNIDFGRLVTGMAMGPMFQDSAENINKNAQGIIAGYSNYNPLAPDAATGGGFNGQGTPGPQSELEKQTQHLAAIERNTSPEQRNSVLGGGNLGAKGISAVELSDMKRGGGKVDRAFSMLKEAIGEIAAEQAQSMLKNARRSYGF